MPSTVPVTTIVSPDSIEESSGLVLSAARVMVWLKVPALTVDRSMVTCVLPPAEMEPIEPSPASVKAALPLAPST